MNAASKPARVLHVVKLYRPDFSGEAVFLERSSAVMRELAPSVEHDLLVTRTPRPAEPDPAPCPSLARAIYLCPRPIDGLAWYVRFVWWIATHLHRYDTIHFRTHIDWYFVTYLLVRLTGRRLVHSATLDDTVSLILRNHYRPALRPLAARGMRLFHAYIAISPKLLEETRDVVDAERTHLVPCGILAPPQPSESRDRIRAEIGARAGEPVLISVGGLCERKDQRFLIEAMPDLIARHPQVKLVLVGPTIEPDYVAGLARSIDRLGLAGRVILAGERQDPHPWFAAADLMVFASRQEGFGTVVPEAMAHGLPVVVRRLPGVNDWFVLDGKTGFLFEDRPGFTEAVDRLLADHELRRRIGAEARRFATTRFDMRATAARYLEIYGLAGRICPPPADATLGTGCKETLPEHSA